MSAYADIRRDLSAFADDDEEIIISADGTVVMSRGGMLYEFKLRLTDAGAWSVLHNGVDLPYRRFLARDLGRLDVLAERIRSKRHGVPGFVDGPGELESVGSEARLGAATELLDTECRDAPPFASRVLFVTADAGQGKTALLREYQARVAEEFAAGQSPFLFWHVDLQGRQLLRLSEALMGDLGELRVSGLWMPAVVTLLRHRLLVLAIDGFDELAAEQGSTDALGALAMLVRDMGDSGTIIAASRRSFFDTDDYLRRVGQFQRSGVGECEFNQLALRPWRPAEARALLSMVGPDGASLQDPDKVFEDMRQELGADDHPMLTRPFLLSQVKRALLTYDVEPREFLRGMEDPLKGVGDLIRRFVEREVSEKWKQKDTGEPFLSSDQHLRLLADVAEEMLRSQRAYLDLEIIDAITTLLLDEWVIPEGRRQQIIEMVRMHALLIPVNEDFSVRGFEHPEFRDWFTAYSLAQHLIATDGGPTSALRSLLSTAVITDTTARYAAGMIQNRWTVAHRLAAEFEELSESEWRPTYLQQNLGTIVPFLVDDLSIQERLTIDARLVYGSLVFERSRLRNVEISRGLFVNASFREVDWADVVLRNCDLGDLTVSDARFERVAFVDCRLGSLGVIENGDEHREYSPIRIRALLQRLGIAAEIGESPPGDPDDQAVSPSETDLRREVTKLLRIFRRTTIVAESLIRQKFGAGAQHVIGNVMPLLEQWEIVEPREWRGAGNQHAWVLAHGLEEILGSDGHPDARFSDFWSFVDE